MYLEMEIKKIYNKMILEVVVNDEVVVAVVVLLVLLLLIDVPFRHEIRNTKCHNIQVLKTRHWDCFSTIVSVLFFPSLFFFQINVLIAK